MQTHLGRKLCHLPVGELGRSGVFPGRLRAPGPDSLGPFSHTCLEGKKHYFLFCTEDSHGIGIPGARWGGVGSQVYMMAAWGASLGYPLSYLRECSAFVYNCTCLKSSLLFTTSVRNKTKLPSPSGPYTAFGWWGRGLFKRNRRHLSPCLLSTAMDPMSE